jgi:hypothetical protein
MAKMDTIVQLPQWVVRNDDPPHSGSEENSGTWGQVLLPTDLHFFDTLEVLQSGVSCDVTPHIYAGWRREVLPRWRCAFYQLHRKRQIS